jgi:hypothetical protein
MLQNINKMAVIQNLAAPLTPLCGTLVCRLRKQWSKELKNRDLVQDLGAEDLRLRQCRGHLEVAKFTHAKILFIAFSEKII